MFPFILPENIRKPEITFKTFRDYVKKCETKSFTIPIKDSIISKLFKILNNKGNIGKKKFRTEIITLSFFVSF